MPSRGRRLALGATAVVTVGLGSAFASAIGAQTSSDPILTEVVSVDDTGTLQELPDTPVAAISDTGAVVVYETAAPGTADPATDSPLAGRRVWIRDRIASTSRAAAEDGSVAPGVSGDGCVVAYTVVTDLGATLTTVDRCAADSDFPLPVGTVIGSLELDMLELDTARVAPPSLSFDGSTIVWSTGREILRYERPAVGGTYALSHTFDVVADGSTEVVTGSQTDVSADGRNIVFVAGPGTAPFEPTPANVYVWTLDAAPSDPELVSVATSGGPGLSDSTSPTISADGSYVVFESTEPGLAAVDSLPVTAPFVVGVDRIARTGQVLVDVADRPAVSADGNHVVYRRGDAVRVRSTDATATIDHAIDELAQARPSGTVAISQYGRWLVFTGTTDIVDAPVGSLGSTGSANAAPAVLAVDRASSNSEVVDTTTAPTQPTTTVTTTTVVTTTSTPPTGTVPEVASLPTVPATTLVPSVIVPRFPTVTSRFPTVGLPQAPRRVVGTSPSGSSFDSTFDSQRGLTAYASPLSFEPTVIDAGRRVQPVILTNSGSLAVGVAGVDIDVPAVFAVVADNCTGTSISPASSCAVDVQFAPVTIGRVSATVTFRLIDGSLVSATIDGEGVAEPTLDLVPAVAGAGQTVTVFGAGFPPGSTVELTRPGSSTPESIVVDVDGTFAHVVVVLPNTPVGSTELSVRGQPDAFNDVAAELLVSSRRATSADAALRGGPGGLLGR